MILIFLDWSCQSETLCVSAPSFEIWAFYSQIIAGEFCSWQSEKHQKALHVLEKKLIKQKPAKCAQKTRSSVLSQTRGPVWHKCQKREKDFVFSEDASPGRDASTVQWTWGKKKVGFLQPVITAEFSQKSSRRPPQEFKKGQRQHAGDLFENVCQW